MLPETSVSGLGSGDTRELKVRRGLTLPIYGTPRQAIEAAPRVSKVALLGRDYPGIRVQMIVAEGDSVRKGQPLFRDRQRPDLLFTSPGSGRVEAIHRGARRALQAVVIALDEHEDSSAPFSAMDNIAHLPREDVQKRLCESGLWTAFRTRPFSHIPDPGSVPAAIFITAIDTNPLAADPAVVLSDHQSDLGDGLGVLARLTDGPLYFCRAPGMQMTLPKMPNLVEVSVEGPHPAGLPGTHIHLLHPANASTTVWHLNYQDLVAIGRLFTRGELLTERVIAWGGPAAARPRLLRTRIGANTEELVSDELSMQACRVVSGSVFAGHHAAGWACFLGRYHLQLSALAEGQERQFLGWLMPGFDKFSAVRAYAGSLKPHKRFPMTTSQQGSPRAMVPFGNFEKVMPLDILPAPLLKALIVEDTETAQALGCLELDEEDLALCSFVCASKYDYGVALRKTLNLIEQGS